VAESPDQEEQILSLTISALCDDPSIKVRTQVMDNLVLSTLLKYMIVRDVLPKTQPLKHIKTFEDFCRVCVFPFLVFENNEET